MYMQMHAHTDMSVCTLLLLPLLPSCMYECSVQEDGCFT